VFGEEAIEILKQSIVRAHDATVGAGATVGKRGHLETLPSDCRTLGIGRALTQKEGQWSSVELCERLKFDNINATLARLAFRNIRLMLA